ncbi:N-6 DNA methylase [Lacibacter sp.]|uniref:N-6 DNA methylase n=1 Tax=Lacibacter sp. TaxID=1915409 RepID=UPI002B4AD897|nr:N-6 DNA methylase [Lacibacter sp.]HLP38208.1 N-6 DNA methylase [Lacibacter sp.]
MHEIQKSYEDGVLLHIKKSVRKLINVLPIDLRGRNFHVIPFLLVLYKKKILLYSSLRTNTQISIGDLIADYKGADAEYVKAVYSTVQKEIGGIPYTSLFEIVQLLDVLDEETFFEKFSLIFEDYILFLQQNLGKAIDIPLLPQELVHVLTGLERVKVGANVYNPFAGDHSLAIELAGVARVITQDSGRENWALGIIRAMACGFEDLSWLLHSFPFNDEKVNEMKFDLIVSAPPFRLKLLNSNFNATSIEDLVIRKSVDMLKPDGKLVILVAPSFTSSESKADTKLRRFLVANDYLEKVISFPGALLPHTSIPFSILVISRQKEKEGKVLFVDAEETVKQLSKREKRIDVDHFFELIASKNERSNLRYIDNEDIAENDFKLNVNRYLIHEEDYSNTRYEIVPLSSLVTSVSRNTKIIEKLTGRFIRIRDLKSNLEDYKINLNDIAFEELPKHVYRVDEPSLLLALRFSQLKPSMVTEVYDPYYVSNDILALNVDFTKVDIRYLISELKSSYVETQVGKFRMGATIPYISKNDILQLKIRLLTLEEQKLRVEAELDILDRNKLTPYEEDEKETNNAVAEQNVFLRHKLAGPAQTLGGTVQNLIDLLEKHVFTSYPDLKKLKLSEKHLFTLEDYLRIMMKESDSLLQIVSRQLRVEQEIEQKKLVPIDMVSFLEEYVQDVLSRPSRLFDIKFGYTPDEEADGKVSKSLYILANGELLKDMLDNLLENAVVHAFKGTENNRIEISLFTNPGLHDDVEVQLLVSNTGKPLSETFILKDYIRKGFSSGDNAGEGFGGWYINEIVKKFSGRLDYIDETGPEGLPETDLATSFEFSFPIYINE